MSNKEKTECTPDDHQILEDACGQGRALSTVANGCSALNETWKDFVKAQNEALGVRSEPAKRAQDTKPSTRQTAIKESIRNLSAGHRVSHTFGEMNGLEKRYGAHLDIRKAVGEIISWKFEPIKLKLAQSTFYNIDFLLWMSNGSIELHEAKGHWEDDSRVKIKVAAQLFPEFKFVAVQWDKARGDWKFEEFVR